MTTKQKPKQQPLDPATIEVDGRYIYDSGRGTRLLVTVEYLYADKGEATVQPVDRYAVPSGWTYGRKVIKLNRLVTTEKQEKHRRNIAKFWNAKERGRRQVARVKQWEQERVEDQAVAELPEVKEFLKTANYLAELLERRAKDIREKAQRTITQGGTYWSYPRVAGDILAEYAGNSGVSGLGEFVTEAIDAETADREYRKTEREAKAA